MRTLVVVINLWRALYDLDHLVRFHQLGFVAVWPLLGLACVGEWSPVRVGALVIISLFFNTYGVVLDDAVHVEVDRRDPLRAVNWLVRGVITPRAAHAVAIAQLPLMIAVHLAAGFPAYALGWLAGAVLGQGIYDIYGKRFPVPPLMEAAEAAAAFQLVLYGAAVTGVPFPSLVWPTALAGAWFILLVNGFHGSLRDIDVEIHCNQRTTPIWLGCRGTIGKVVDISRSMSAYAAVCQFALLATSLFLATRLSSPEDGRAALTMVGAAAAVNLGLFVALHLVKKPAWDVVMRIHVTVLMVPVMLAFTAPLTAGETLLLFGLYFGPTLLTACFWAGWLAAPIGETTCATPTRLAATSYPTEP
jgi:4-hydroxybenzoate polyprenyltransferase